ncbi:MAG TPA: cupin domain-containing protein [Bryobacteraceae bacterium]
MTNEYDFAGELARPAAVNEPSRGRRLWGLGAAALVAACLLGVFARGHADAQVSPVQINALAQGHNTQNKATLHVFGPSDVLQTQLVFQPGGAVGWHMHPGPVVVVVNTGALTEIHSDGCTTQHPAGSVFFEEAGVVHNAVNQTSGVTEVYATFISPTGAQPLIPVPDPGTVCPNQKGRN